MLNTLRRVRACALFRQLTFATPCINMCVCVCVCCNLADIPHDVRSSLSNTRLPSPSGRRANGSVSAKTVSRTCIARCRIAIVAHTVYHYAREPYAGVIITRRRRHTMTVRETAFPPLFRVCIVYNPSRGAFLLFVYAGHTKKNQNKTKQTILVKSSRTGFFFCPRRWSWSSERRVRSRGTSRTGRGVESCNRLCELYMATCEVDGPLVRSSARAVFAYRTTLATFRRHDRCIGRIAWNPRR